MRGVAVLGMALLVGGGLGVACATPAGPVIVVEAQPRPSATVDDGGAMAMDAAGSDGDSEVAKDAAVAADAGADAPFEPCARLMNYDSYCADPDAGFGISKPYAYDCAPGDVAGDDCSSKMARVWCCMVAH